MKLIYTLLILCMGTVSMSSSGMSSGMIFMDVSDELARKFLHEEGVVSSVVAAAAQNSSLGLANRIASTIPWAYGLAVFGVKMYQHEPNKNYMESTEELLKARKFEQFKADPQSYIAAQKQELQRASVQQTQQVAVNTSTKKPEFDSKRTASEFYKDSSVILMSTQQSPTTEAFKSPEQDKPSLTVTMTSGSEQEQLQTACAEHIASRELTAQLCDVAIAQQQYIQSLHRGQQLQNSLRKQFAQAGVNRRAKEAEIQKKYQAAHQERERAATSQNSRRLGRLCSDVDKCMRWAMPMLIIQGIAAGATAIISKYVPTWW